MVEEVNVPLQDVLHTFKKGHRIMIQIHSTWFPYIDRNPQKYVPNIFEAEETDFIKSTITVTGASTVEAGGAVKKTGRALIVHEDSLSWGLGSEIAARIADDLFPWLDAPVRRVASLDTWVAYAPQVEDAILPQSENVLHALLEIAEF